MILSSMILLAAALGGLVGGPGQVPGAVSAVCDAAGFRAFKAECDRA